MLGRVNFIFHENRVYECAILCICGGVRQVGRRWRKFILQAKRSPRDSHLRSSERLYLRRRRSPDRKTELKFNRVSFPADADVANTSRNYAFVRFAWIFRVGVFVCENGLIKVAHSFLSARPWDFYDVNVSNHYPIFSLQSFRGEKIEY